MTRFSHRWINSVLIAAALVASLLPLRALVSGGGALVETTFLLLIAGATGAGLTALKLPRAVVLISQGIVSLAFVVWRGLVLAQQIGADASNPLAALREVGSQGLSSIRRGIPPLDSSPGIVWLLLLLTLLLIMVVELLVNGLEQTAWAAAPLSLVFTVAAITTRDELHWLFLVPLVTGYVLLLATTTATSEDAAGGHRGAQVAGKASIAACVTALALVAALLLAPVVPSNAKQAWTSDAGDGPIQLTDPSVRLEQDLRRPVDSRVMVYRTDTGEPVYLRTVAMPVLTTTGARLEPMDLGRFGMNTAYDFPGKRVEVTVEMAEVTSEYLPAPFAVDSIKADGGWSFDPKTMSVIASGVGREQQTKGLSYSVVSFVPSPSKDELLAAEAGTPADGEATLQVPEGISQEVEQLTQMVTAEAPTAGAKALAIQKFLRSDRFTYTLDAPRSSGADAISNFLLHEYAGYCIHFASAMITMARQVGIPARMAVGYAPGEQQASGSYEVTAHDAHAWPELYFESLGWVPFEPTPTFDGPSGYTDPKPTPSASASPSASPSSSQTPQASESPSASASVDPSLEPVEVPGANNPKSTGLSPVLMWAIGTVIALLVLASPMLIRFGQRVLRLRRRASTVDTANGAWRETEALLADYGYPEVLGTPGLAIAPITGFLPDQAVAPLRTIALTVERNRFARDPEPVAQLREHVKTLKQELRQEASRKQRWLALLLPQSLWRALRKRGFLRFRWPRRMS